ncbi:MAG: photosystem II S4 domain protein [Cyanobacteriota bacterium]|nr:photosystem II S4 domain protein [Cyanobacteriota bacterium]
MVPRSELLQGTEHRESLARLLDLAEQSLKTWQVTYSDFLSPPEIAEALSRFQRLTEVGAVAWGGYAQAERQRLAISRPEMLPSREQIPLAALNIQGNFLFDTATHPDFLGAILGTGIVRDKVGDLLVLGEQGSQVIVLPEIADYLQTHLTQVRSVPVKVKGIPLGDLKIRPPQTKAIASVEASLRLDALASAGFSMSRSKMVQEIERGEVRVNWKTVTQPSHPLNPQDLVTIRGRGRLQIDDVAETKKGRYRVQMTRFL